MVTSVTGGLDSTTRETITEKNNNDCLWPEFKEGMCEMLNSQRCLVVAASPEMAVSVCHSIDDVCRKFHSNNNNNNDNNNNTSEKEKNSDLLALQNAPRVTFTTEENISKLQKCTAIYGRVPIFIVMEMEHDLFYALDLPENNSNHNHNNDHNNNSDNHNNSDNNSTLLESIETFLRGIVRGTVPKALQGDAPPLNDQFTPNHGINLINGLCAVTSTIQRLKRERPGGALCVFWSERCRMCPAVIMLLDRLVGFVWAAAASRGLARPFHYFICNIDRNDLPEGDWPSPRSAQVVPATVAYNKKGDRVVFKEKRTAAALMAFICEYCLPKPCSAAEAITAEAMKAAGAISVDMGWGCDSNTNNNNTTTNNNNGNNNSSNNNNNSNNSNTTTTSTNNNGNNNNNNSNSNNGNSNSDNSAVEGVNDDLEDHTEHRSDEKSHSALDPSEENNTRKRPRCCDTVVESNE